MASSGTQRSIQFNSLAAQLPMDAMTTSEEKENKSADASVVSFGIFSRNSLRMLCLEKLLSEEHSLESLGHQLPPLLSDGYTQFKQEKLKLLLAAILRGDPETAKQLSKAYPILLLEKLNNNDFVTAPSGHKANATPYRLALAVEDTQMAALLKDQLIKVAGEQEAEKQLTEQFPTGWQEEEEKKSAPIFAQLDTLALAIRDAEAGDITSNGDRYRRLKVQPGSEVAIALAQFRSLLDATLEEVVTTGRHFNPNLLLCAYEIYDMHYKDYFGNSWRNTKAMLFWQQAIGYVQRFMPANYAQAFCEGLLHTNFKLQQSAPQGRSFEFQNYNGSSWATSNFYPLTDSRLGYDFAIASGYGGPLHGWVAANSGTSLLYDSSFKDYVNQKQLANNASYSSAKLSV